MNSYTVSIMSVAFVLGRFLVDYTSHLTRPLLFFTAELLGEMGASRLKNIRLA